MNTPFHWRRLLLVYMVGTALVATLFLALDEVIDHIVPAAVPMSVVHMAAILLLGLFIFSLREPLDRFLANTAFRRSTQFRLAVPKIHEELSHSTDTHTLAETVLRTLSELLQAPDSQLTLYYDQPFALEVTHLRWRHGELTTTVERVREDEPSLDMEDGDVLTPVSAEITEVLTHRDRLVGLLLIAPRPDGRPYNALERELLGEIVPAISSGADQVMMIRNISETNQRLFENEKLISIGQLASGIAHEIRNPLTSIKLNLQGLKKSGRLGDRDSRRVQISLDEIDRLDNIVSEVMQFARRTKLDVAPMDAERVVRTSLQSVRSELQQRGIDVVREVAPYLPEVRADENRLIRALINLIINAAQAMEQGGTIRVRVDAYGTGLEFQVMDQGPGIPENLRREVFNPFFTTKADGTGLGLANALKFVQEHGGELDFSTVEGEGTTFSLRLPPAPPSHLDDPTALRVMPT